MDTARAYDDSESIIGEVIRSHDIRDQIVLASKTQASRDLETIPMIRRDLEESLRRLQTDRIDLYYMHAPPADPYVMNKVFDEFEILKNEGKIISIGASIKGPSVTCQTTDLCRQYIDSGRVDAIQLIYSILRQKTAEIFGYAYQHEVAIVARTVIESGFLSGKYRPGHEFESGHRTRWTGEQLSRILDMAHHIEQTTLKPPYRSMAQIAIEFALDPKEVSSVIPGAKTPEQVRDNMEVGTLPRLAPEIVDSLKRQYTGMEDVVNPAG
ncbi:MAG: aldo/keto reductase [Candidatus Hydrogenedentes bacterium]|nr:aldo/keto reductase [Candidatus Hydrogenedentota bacterium]